MSIPIRELARELYRLQQEVEKIEAELAAAPFSQQAPIAERLRLARAERQRLRHILDGEKAPPPFRTPVTTFKREK